MSRKEIRTVVVCERTIENQNQLGRVVQVLERARPWLQAHPVAAPGSILIIGNWNPEKARKHCIPNLHRPPVALINRIPTAAVLDLQSEENHFIAHFPGSHFLSVPVNERRNLSCHASVTCCFRRRGTRRQSVNCVPARLRPLLAIAGDCWRLLAIGSAVAPLDKRSAIRQIPF
ncbi:hypothetical protein [Paraburkholderia sp. RL18-085-BIA-A]|uniref:hypothetical protein n=1 Tax=Paraburkholderia sp. RL18-085-BIA-A TaxID=3031633 RepID=UPI0038BBA523